MSGDPRTRQVISGSAALVASMGLVIWSSERLHLGVILVLFLVALASLLLPHRTGMFPFLFLFGIVLYLSKASGIGMSPEPERDFLPMFLTAIAVLASSELLFLRHGLRVKPHEPFVPTVGGSADGSAVWGMAWRVMIFGLLAWGATHWVPNVELTALRRAGYGGLSRVGAYIWIIAGFLLAARIVRGVASTIVADRLTARMIVQDAVWRWLKGPLRLMAKSRMRGD